MVAYGVALFAVLPIATIVILYFYTRPTRIILTADSLTIDSAYKDYVYARRNLVYEGPVSKETWSKGLYRRFGDGWPLPLAGKFHSTVFGDVVIVSITKPDVLQRLGANGKTLLLQLSDEQVSALGPPVVERTR
jgi:hypothetical protein